MRYSSFTVFLIVALLGGCSFVSTTTDTTAQLGEGITNAMASSSDGTSGAEDDDSVRATQFVESQLVQLRRDAAAGNGEHLRALANLMGESDATTFGLWVQSNYSELFERQRSAADLVDYIATQRG